MHPSRRDARPRRKRGVGEAREGDAAASSRHRRGRAWMQSVCKASQGSWTCRVWGYIIGLLGSSGLSVFGPERGRVTPEVSASLRSCIYGYIYIYINVYTNRRAYKCRYINIYIDECICTGYLGESGTKWDSWEMRVMG